MVPPRWDCSISANGVTSSEIAVLAKSRIIVGCDLDRLGVQGIQDCPVEEAPTPPGSLYEYQNKGDAKFAVRKFMKRKDYFFRNEGGVNQNGNGSKGGVRRSSARMMSATHGP